MRRFWRSPLVYFVVSDFLVLIAHVTLSGRLGFFHLDKEGNLGSLQAGIKLWIAATAAILAALVMRRVEVAWNRWLSAGILLLGFGLAYIGLDDMMAIHERLGFVVNNAFEIGGFYGESFNWLWYFSPLMVAAVGLFILLALWFWKEHRPVSVLLGVGLIFWVLALAAEWLGRAMILATNLQVGRYRHLILVEESTEMLGASFVATATLALFQRLQARHVRIG